MKLSWFCFILLFCFYGCKKSELPSEYLTNISVVRQTQQKMSSPKASPAATEQTVVSPPPAFSQTRYHIIVGSFSASEKARAEKLVQQLKAREYPATLIKSSQRYRVSIESFPTEAQANAARDEYRKITDRQDIWVHKAE